MQYASNIVGCEATQSRQRCRRRSRSARSLQLFPVLLHHATTLTSMRHITGLALDDTASRHHHHPPLPHFSTTHTLPPHSHQPPTSQQSSTSHPSTSHPRHQHTHLTELHHRPRAQTYHSATLSALADLLGVDCRMQHYRSAKCTLPHIYLLSARLILLTACMHIMRLRGESDLAKSSMRSQRKELLGST